MFRTRGAWHRLSPQFPIGKPMPYELISRIVKFRVAENIKNAEEKLKKKK